MVQILTDMNLIIKRAYISSDGEWFMDGMSPHDSFLLYIYVDCKPLDFQLGFIAVFHVTDQYGNKLSDDNVAERIQQVSLLTWTKLV